MIGEQGDNLVFICGLPRSGTTLLSALLGNHPEALVPPEPWFLLRLADVHGQAAVGRPYDDHIAAQAVKAFLSRDQFLDSARAFARTAYNRILAETGARVFIDKTPRYFHILDFVRDLFPRARMIWLKRNPLDVAASYKTTWNRGIPFLTGESLDATSFDFLTGFHNLERFFDRLDPEKCEVRYEDLVSRPEEELKRLAEFCSLEYTTELQKLDNGSLGLSRLSRSPLGDQKIYSQPGIHGRSVGAWEQQLEEAEAGQVAAIVGRRMFERLGYPETVSRHPGLFAAEPDETDRERARLELVARSRAWNLNTSEIIFSLENQLRKSEADTLAAQDAQQAASDRSEKAEAAEHRLRMEVERIRAALEQIAASGAAVPALHLELKQAWSEAERLEKEMSSLLAKRELDKFQIDRLRTELASQPSQEMLEKLSQLLDLVRSDHESRQLRLLAEKASLESQVADLTEKHRQIKDVAADQERRRRQAEADAAAALERYRSLEAELKSACQRADMLSRKLIQLAASPTYRLGKAAIIPLLTGKNLARTLRSRLTAALAPGKMPPLRLTRLKAKLDLADQLQIDYGRHRSGWKYGLRFLKPLHTPQGVLFDSFIERTFCWNPQGIQPHTRPWIGIIHVPPKVPAWFLGEQANDKVFALPAWKESLAHCLGIFTLSDYHRRHLEGQLPVPVNRLFFPTEIPSQTWSWRKFHANRKKRMVQIGWWLRKLHAIYQLPPSGYVKTVLDCGHPLLPELMKREREILEREGQFHEGMYRTVETIHFLSNPEYDRLLCENIVFISLYDASANNTITECIARNTPILVNPIEPVREYLGDDYPFYFNSLEEAAQKAADFDLVYRTHLYLVRHPLKRTLKGRFFLQTMANSPIYRNLPIGAPG